MKTALVTGGNKGIGLEIVRQLAGRGFRVFLGARNAERGKQAVESLGKTEGEVVYLPIDVNSPESIAEAAAAVSEQVDCLDVLINNAAILLDENESALTIDDEIIDSTLRSNVYGPWRVTKAFLPLLRKSKDARVINMSSGAGSLSAGSGWAPAYSVSKTALNGVTVQLALALKPEGIPVNAVCPGWVRTDMGGPAATRSVQEGADTPVWLATEAPRKLTGKFIRDREVMSW